MRVGSSYRVLAAAGAFVLAAPAFAKPWQSCAVTHVNGRYAVEACAIYPDRQPEPRASVFNISAIGVDNDSSVTVHPIASRYNVETEKDDRVHDFGNYVAGRRSGTISYNVRFDGAQVLSFEFHQGGDVVYVWCNSYGCIARPTQ